MKTNFSNILIKIQFILGRCSPLRLVNNFGAFIVVENAEGRRFSADITKAGQLKKNSVRIWTA